MKMSLNLAMVLFLGLFIAVVMPMVQSAEETGQAAVANSESIFNSINDFTDGN